MGSGWSNSSTIRLTEVGGAPAVTARDSLEVEIAGGLRQPFVAGRLFNDVGVASNFIFGDAREKIAFDLSVEKRARSL